ncbi:MAG: acetyl-CoA acetyltransferase [Actinomycetota bacterium]
MEDLSRRPVLVAGAQWLDRHPEPESAPAPIDVLERVVREAGEQARITDPAVVDTLAVIPCSGWQANNAPGALAARLEMSPAELVDTGNGGEIGIRVINWMAQRIVDGESDVAVLAGANNMRTLDLAARQGSTLEWTHDADGEPRRFSPRRADASTEMEAMSGIRSSESAVGLALPIQMYPLFENALAHHFGRSIDEHMRLVGEMFSRFTRVAAENPYAWFPVERSAEELITPTETNRMISFPYTKYLNAILQTDQAAALVVVSVAKARELGIPEDQWVHWWGGNHAQEEAFYVTTRPSFSACPSMLDSHAGALANAGVALDDVDLIDFYSCFPSAVEMACRMLGLDLDDPRNFTITGGLPYAGGPGSAYPLHSLATVHQRLREKPEAKALITGNGFYLTKHAASVWSGRPFEGDRPAATHPDRFAAGFEREPVEPVLRSGTGEVETFTVVHDRSGHPERAIALGRFDDDNSRFVAVGPQDEAVMTAFETDGLIGRRVAIEASEGGCRFEPLD